MCAKYYIMKLLLIILIFSPLMSIAQPTATIINKKLEHLNDTRVDPYFWMNQRDSKEVLEYLDAENSYTKSYFDKLQPTVNKLLAEFEQRIDPNEENVPYEVNGITYQSKNIEGKDYEVLYQIKNGKQSVYFDENERAKGKSFYSLADWSPSTNNNLLAFSEDFVGRRKYTIRFRDNLKNVILKEEITNTDGNIVWANDNKTIFYVRKDEQTLREFQIMRHTLGTSSSKDVIVYEEKDERFSVFLSKSLTKKFVYIHSQSSTTNETLLIDADKPDTKPQIFLARKQDHLYEVEHHLNGFYILSNYKAVNNSILFSSSIPTKVENMQTILANDDKIFLENLNVLNEYLIIQKRENGLLEIEIRNIGDKKVKKINFDEEAYYVSAINFDDYNSTKIKFVYNSLTTPSTCFNYDIPSDIRVEYFTKKLRDPNFKSSDYQSERIWALANDGTEIPITIVYKKGIKLSEAPLLLYGYGSYGITIPDVFSATRISLLDRGFVYAIAHIRGSKYLGENWYQDGKFLKKKNTFTDFINSAEWLARKGYCAEDKIFAQGGSAGGLLMGAVANMAPYLFKGIIAQVPFVDVVSTMLDETIPLTVGEYEEWGNPNVQKYYDYMLSYSPYDNIHKMDYPSMFITTGYHDSQVQYWEPAKWVAKLRTMKTDNNILMFDCNMDAGHGGGSGRSTERLEKAKEFAFILSLLNLE